MESIRLSRPDKGFLPRYRVDRRKKKIAAVTRLRIHRSCVTRFLLFHFASGNCRHSVELRWNGNCKKRSDGLRWFPAETETLEMDLLRGMRASDSLRGRGSVIFPIFMVSNRKEAK